MKMIAVLLLAACASPTVMPRERFEALKEVEEPAVAVCAKLGRFVGVSALPGDAGMEQAREAARYKAAGAGATHLVAGDETQTPDFTSAAVKAYDCNAPRTR